jgi:hypothetical protein
MFEVIAVSMFILASSFVVWLAWELSPWKMFPEDYKK